MKKLYQRQINNLVKFISGIEVIGICLIIAVAFWFQLAMGELPCPLCLLQRLGLLAIAFGFLLNIRYHVRPSHYALSLLAAIFTAFVSLRQISLHVTDPVGYGSTVFGLHMYTWTFVVAMIAIIYIAIVMSFPRQYEIKSDASEYATAKSKRVRIFTQVAFGFLALMVFANITSTLLECGLTECPDDPTAYTLIQKS